MKKIELKVSFNCSKCKTIVLKAVAKLEGVNEITIDAEKGMLTVVGEVDPVTVTRKVRKTGKHVEMISVGPPKKPEEKKPELPLPHCCPQCQVIITETYDFGGRICTIL
ncbi:OLC1v1038725C1 [Oldenlandia corymbosa var. corymbosa]|uniref:OLC1v1038725C1 n=1 Tax=Oldenlandia corymbosa var. corymbosa TaxID=529605 RepID=A0AAV1D0J1_OLDCO|nr:OLC1v1038725C1 [Oldenlandia corymbosa var. corymbosa]